MIDPEVQKELNVIKKNVSELSQKIDKITKANVKYIYSDILESIDKCQKYVDHYNMLKKFRDNSTDSYLTQLLDKLVNELNNIQALNQNVKVDLEKMSYQHYPSIPVLREYCIKKINENKER